MQKEHFSRLTGQARQFYELIYFGVVKYLRCNGLITIPVFKSAWKVWLSITHSDSSESCALMNSAKFEKFS
jgi:hypothetical protein